MSQATSTTAALSFAPLSPTDLPSDFVLDHRPSTTAMATVNDDQDDRSQEQPSSDLVYTPATTAASCNDSAADENAPEPNDRTSAAWNEWWNTEALTAQVKDLSSELAELKQLVSKQHSVSENTHEHEQEDDLLRLKENHRSSLASLADTHRSEMANVATAHKEEMMKIELQHIEELRTAKRTHGSDRQLVQGLHESYSRQIENLVIDLSESRRRLRELQLQKTVSSPPPPAARHEQASTKLLGLRIEFKGLDDALSLLSVFILHPGPSFQSFLTSVRHTVINYLQTLKASTHFFAGNNKAVFEAQKISYWYSWALADRIAFRFRGIAAVDDLSMEQAWEGTLWKSEEQELGLICVADPYGDGSFCDPEWQDSGILQRPVECSTPPPEQLVSVENESADEFDTAAELDRINKELGNLEIDRQRFTFKLEETTLEESCKENYVRNRHPTVESVEDEDDPPVRLSPVAEESKVGVAVSTSPAFQQKKSRFSEDLESNAFAQNPDPGFSVISDGSVLERFLEEKERAKDTKRKTGPKSSSSLNWDDIFSPLPGDKSTDGLQDKGKVVEDLDESDPQKSELHSSSGAHVFGQSSTRGNVMQGQEWRWIPGADALRSPTAQMSGGSSRRDTSYYDAESSSVFGALKQDAASQAGGIQESDRDSFRTEEEVPRPMRDRSYFNFMNAASPAPPPAPEPSGRDSPTIPACIQSDMENVGAHLGEQYADENPMMTESQLDNPFADLKAAPCDTPIMDTSRSVVSTTPLLDDDATGRKSGPFSPLPAEPLVAEHSGRRGPPSFAPLSSSPKDSISQNSKKSPPRFSSYNMHKNNEGDTQKSWEERSQSSVSTIEGNWESGSVEGEKKCGHGDGSEAYTWRRGSQEDEYHRSRSISPPPSRSSTTTTDRNSEFIVPPNLYPQTYPQHMGSNNSSNMGGFRYGQRPPLGPQHMFMMNSGPEALRSHMKKMNEMMFAANRLGPRSSGAQSFSNGPVYAPNPPHSGTTYSGGVAVDPATAFGCMNPPQQMPYDGTPWLLHSPAFGPPHMGGPMWGGSEPRRSYSNDSISPLLWKVDGHSEGLQVMSGPMLPPQPGLVPQTHPAAGSIIDQQANYPTPSGVWPPMGGNFGQPGTPGSRVSMQNHPANHPAASHPAAWYQGIPPDVWGSPMFAGGWN